MYFFFVEFIIKYRVDIVLVLLLFRLMEGEVVSVVGGSGFIEIMGCIYK